nr:MAG TPA: hypothetical protein [Siphoviridae sp. ct5YG1]
MQTNANMCNHVQKVFRRRGGRSVHIPIKADIFPGQSFDRCLSLTAHRGNVHVQYFGGLCVGPARIVQSQKNDLRLCVHRQDGFVDILDLTLSFFQGVDCSFRPGGPALYSVGHFYQKAVRIRGRLDAGRVVADAARVGSGSDFFQVFFQGGALGVDLCFYGRHFLVVVLQNIVNAAGCPLCAFFLLFGVHAVHPLSWWSLEGKITVFPVHFLEVAAGHVVGGQASGGLVFRGAFGVRELHFVSYHGKPGPFVSLFVGVRVNLDPSLGHDHALALPEILRHELRRFSPGDDRNEVRFFAVELPVHSQGKGRHRDAGRRVFQFRIARQASGQFHVVHIESPSFHFWANFVIRYSSPQGSFFWARPHRNKATPIFNDCQVVILPVPVASLRTNDFP